MADQMDEYAAGYDEGFSESELLALSRVFYERLSAGQLLDRAGLERPDHPQTARTSKEYWSEVDGVLRAGLFPSGRVRILRAAAEQYRANPVFAAAADGPGGTGPPSYDSTSTSSRRAQPPDPGGPARAGGRTTVTMPAGGWFRPADGLPEHVTIVALDAVGYSRRGMLVQLAFRDGIAEVVQEAFARAGIPPGAVESEDRGDGFLAAVSARIPKATVVADFARELATALRAYNRTRSDEGRIRLRLALHEGDVIRHNGSWAGDAAVVGARLVDAAPVRDALCDNPSADLALVVSSALFESTVREELRGLDPDLFSEVAVRTEKYQAQAWLTIPGMTTRPRTQPAAASARRTSGPPDGDPPAEGRKDVAKWDFFLSVAEKDEAAWGAWIAWYLAEENYRVHLEAWDVVAGNFGPEVLDDAVRYSTRTIVVLSPAYLDSDKVSAAWLHAWDRDPNGLQRTLIPVRVEECEPAGLLRGIRYIDLVGLDEVDAKETLKEQIRRSVAGQYRPPAPPTFPGGTRG
jgi:hypothetical protein